MESFLLYLLKATICLALFSVFFRLLLMKETFFRFTRITLITGLVVCTVLPLVQLRLDKSYALQQTISNLEETVFPVQFTDKENHLNLSDYEPVDSNHADATMLSDRNAERNPGKISGFTILIVIYWLGVTAMLLRLVISFVRLRHLLRKGRVIESGNYKLIIIPESIIPFSFFHYIVLSQKDYLENPEEIILHEKMHYLKKHNADVIFSELLLVVHWFNPMVWLLCRDLREIHEYEADHAVIEAGIGAQQYQLLLVRKAVGERRFGSVVNSFNQSKIKNRIMMMLRNESPKWARLKVLYTVPLVVVALMAFAQSENIEDSLVLNVEQESTVKQVQSNPFFYWEQVQKFCKENEIDPKDFGAPDHRDLVIILINSKNAVMYTNHEGSARFITKEEGLSNKSVRTLKNMIVGTIENNANKPFYVSLQNDLITSTNFIVTFINHLLPTAYDEALKEISNRQGVSLSEMKESHPLLLLYAVPRSFGTRINSEDNRLDEKSAQFQVRTTTKKEDWEEMAILSGVRINEGNGIESASLKWNDVDENNNDFLKQQKIVFKDSAPSGTVDKALVVVDANMDQSDLTGIHKGLFREDKLAVRETYFVLGLYKW